MRIFYKDSQMRITDITVNTKIKKPIYNDYRIKNGKTVPKPWRCRHK